MEPTECAKAEPPAAATAASTSASLTTAQQSSMPTAASVTSASQRNHPDAANGNSAFAVAAAAASASASASTAKAGAGKEDHPSSALTAVEHKVSGGGGAGGDFDSEVKECKNTVNSERAPEAARSDSAGNNNFPKKISIDEEKTSASLAMVPKEPANKGKRKMSHFQNFLIIKLLLCTVVCGGPILHSQRRAERPQSNGNSLRLDIKVR